MTDNRSDGPVTFVVGYLPTGKTLAQQKGRVETGLPAPPINRRHHSLENKERRRPEGGVPLILPCLYGLLL